MSDTRDSTKDEIYRLRVAARDAERRRLHETTRAADAIAALATVRAELETARGVNLADSEEFTRLQVEASQEHRARMKAERELLETRHAVAALAEQLDDDNATWIDRTQFSKRLRIILASYSEGSKRHWRD